MTAVKICGLKDSENLKAAIDAGANFAGFVFYAPSLRFVTAEIAARLVKEVPANVKSVGLFVNPSDEELANVLKDANLNMMQLHGDETPQRVKEIKGKFKLPVMKAINVGAAEDLKKIAAFDAADWILLDAKIESERGGTGKTFDWNLLRGLKINKPWMLSGGLTAGNVKDALKVAKPDAVDVSSGVESARGVKDAEKIKAFIKTAKTA